MKINEQINAISKFKSKFCKNGKGGWCSPERSLFLWSSLGFTTFLATVLVGAPFSQSMSTFSFINNPCRLSFVHLLVNMWLCDFLMDHPFQ